MTYPCSPMPSLGEFIKRAQEEFGATLNECGGNVMTPKGAVHGRYLERSVGKIHKRAVLPETLKPESILEPNYLRSLCRRLGIDPNHFGFDLSDDW